MNENLKTNTPRVTLEVSLKKGKPTDFKVTLPNGKTHYLYGKTFFVRHDDDLYSVHVFKNTTRVREQFRLYFNEGKVWVVDDEKFLN